MSEKEVINNNNNNNIWNIQIQALAFQFKSENSKASPKRPGRELVDIA